MAATISYNKIDFTLPSGMRVNVDVPAIHDANLVELGLRGYLGTLVALTQTLDSKTSRNQLINLTANLLALSEMITKRIIFANEAASTESRAVIDKLIDSLGKEHNDR